MPVKVLSKICLATEDVGEVLEDIVNISGVAPQVTMQHITDHTVNLWATYEDPTPVDKRKYVIVVVAGQSNAHGFDEGPWYPDTTDVNRDPDRLKYLGYHYNDNLKLLPLAPFTPGLQHLQPTIISQSNHYGPKGPHLPLGNALLDLIPKDYGVIVLPLAYGGGNFTSTNNVDGTWNTLRVQCNELTTQISLRSTSMFCRVIHERIKYCLDLNKDNKFLGFIWCQGESDSSASADDHHNAFKAYTEVIHTALNPTYGDRTVDGSFGNNDWYFFEPCPWYMANQHMKDKYNKYEEFAPGHVARFPNATSENDSNDLPNHNHNASSTAQAHWGNDAYRRIVVPGVIACMEKANLFKKLNKGGTP